MGDFNAGLLHVLVAKYSCVIQAYAFGGRRDSMVSAALAFLGAFGADQSLLNHFADQSLLIYLVAQVECTVP